MMRRSTTPRFVASTEPAFRRTGKVILGHGDTGEDIGRDCPKSYRQISRFARALFVCGIAFVGHLSAATLIGQYVFNNPGNLGLDSSGNGNDLTLTVGTPSQ